MAPSARLSGVAAAEPTFDGLDRTLPAHPFERTANLFALLGLRPLYQLVVEARARLRYMNETISVLLGLVGVKLLSDELFHVGPVASLVSVVGVLTIGAALSVYAARRAPVSAE